jgi:Fe-S-cluster-containing hydrogenase component 2
MPHVIAEACIDCVHRLCTKECPVDCIYEGDRSLYIQPDECIDCSACVPVCPEEAIFHEDDLPEPLLRHRKDNGDFFALVLPGRAEPVGSPGGAKRAGRVGFDTPLVASHASRKVES